MGLASLHVESCFGTPNVFAETPSNQGERVKMLFTFCLYKKSDSSVWVIFRCCAVFLLLLSLRIPVSSSSVPAFSSSFVGPAYFSLRLLCLWSSFAFSFEVSIVFIIICDCFVWMMAFAFNDWHFLWKKAIRMVHTDC